MPSPQRAVWHWLEQPSSLIWLPSSQASPHQTWPSPQRSTAGRGAGVGVAVVGVIAVFDAAVQDAVTAASLGTARSVQPSASTSLPSSQASPSSSRPLPQRSSPQAVEQPSPSTSLPSSHSS